MTTIASTGTLTSSSGSTSLTTGTVQTLELTLANTEYPFTFPAQTKAFIVHPRTAAKVKLAYAAGAIAAGDYLTLPAGCNFGRDGIGSAATTIYLESPTAALLVELESWV